MSDSNSVWRSRPSALVADELPGNVEDLVIGAGITGLVTGLLLARAGRRVAVVDAGAVGSGTTGASSAKVSLLQGTRLTEILGLHSPEVAAAYLEANREGQSWLLRFCETHDVPFQVRRAVTFAGNPKAIQRLEREYAAEQQLGLESEWTTDLDAPFPISAAITLEGQAQIDPIEVAEALAIEIQKHGGAICTDHRVVNVDLEGDRIAVRLENASTASAEHVVLATCVPILDRGFHFAKLQARRSYMIALEGAAPPDGMFLSVGDPVVSVRDVPERGLVLVGGFGHVTGRAGSEQDHLDGLRAWAAHAFPDASEQHAWAAQDYARYDALPEASTLPWSKSRIHLATGYGKWGFTNGVAAALTIAAGTLGEPPQWAERLAKRGGRRTVVDLCAFNAAVGLEVGRETISAFRRISSADPPEGGGKVGWQGLKFMGVSNVDGQINRVRPVCTHLGGTVCWNDADLTWDCPLHGSRFTPSGDVIEGPAAKPLKSE